MISESDICPMCHRAYSEATHHLIFGSAKRRLCDEDGLTIRLCNSCHNMGKVTNRIHDNVAAEALSRMLGQSLYENDMLSKGYTKEQARELFINRYGLSYL